MCTLHPEGKRRVNAAKWLTVYPDGLSWVTCDMHTEMAVGRSFAVAIPLGGLKVMSNENEERAGLYRRLQTAAVSLRSQPMKVTADQVFEAVTKILRRGLVEVGVDPPEIERGPVLDPPDPEMPSIIEPLGDSE
jgi:hypothetical protein